MVTAEQEEESKLKAVSWPDVAEAPIAELLEEIHTAIPYWQKAAAGQSEADVVGNIDTALVFCGGPAAELVRVTLGLPMA